MALYAQVWSGNGRIFMPGRRGQGNGAVLSGIQYRNFRVSWVLGPADEEQVLHVFALGSDTVWTAVKATVVAGE